MKKKKIGMCAFCGKDKEVTNDHVPPRNIFPRPQPNELDLVTVPGCNSCNHRSSKDDEEFKLYISLKSGMEAPTALKLHNSTKRTIQKNRKIRSLVIDNSTPLYFPNGAGSDFSRQIVYKFDPEPVRRVGRKIVKGLYYKHYGKCLEGNADISLYLSEDFKINQMLTIEDLAKDTGKYGVHQEIGKNKELHYIYAQTELEYGTSWVFVFYGVSAMVGLTIPKESIQQLHPCERRTRPR